MKRKIWTNEMIEKDLRECIEILNLERMPTGQELKDIGRNDLHCKISRTKKYSGWAEYLGLELKECHTRKGQKIESCIDDILRGIGYEVERMSTKFPYDLLIDGQVKVDVKSAKVHNYFGTPSYTFGINKPLQTSDIYILVSLSANNEIENIYIVPSHFIKQKSLNIGKKSKYNRFINAWDYIDQYTNFYKTII